MKALHINYVILLGVTITASFVYFSLGQGTQLQTTTYAFSLALFIQWVAIGFAAVHRAPKPTFTSAHALGLWAAGAYPFVLIDRPEFPTWLVLVSVPVGYLMVFALVSAADYILRRMPRLRL